MKVRFMPILAGVWAFFAGRLLIRLTSKIALERLGVYTHEVFVNLNGLTALVCVALIIAAFRSTSRMPNVIVAAMLVFSALLGITSFGFKIAHHIVDSPAHYFTVPLHLLASIAVSVYVVKYRAVRTPKERRA